MIAVLLSMTVISGVAGVLFVFSVVRDAPPIDVKNISALLSENSVVYDSEGNVLDSDFLESRSTNVRYEELPEHLVNAFIAIEDKTFWEHRGFNIVRIAGALIEGLRSGEKISGTSTITQQLARNLYLSEIRGEYSLKRKLIEAYYAVILENDLTKEQIMEAYLNRIALGFGSLGVQAASQGYFSKDVQDLTLAECAALAAITSEPQAYSLVKTLPNASVPDDNENIIYRGGTYTYIYNTKASEKRRHLVLDLMVRQGYITENEFHAAISEDLRDNIKPQVKSAVESSSYFTDYAVREVVSDLSKEFNVTEDEAWNMLFYSGLHIYTTVDQTLQSILEIEFANNDNFPNPVNYARDRAGNIMKPSGGILLYSYDNYFDEDGVFVIMPDEYEWLADGALMLYKGKRLNFYRTESNGVLDYLISLKSMFVRENGVFSTISDGTVLIPAAYKHRDDDGNLIIERKFFTDYPAFFTEAESGLALTEKNYSLSRKVVQPQAAMVIIDHRTGEIKAMAGGRGTEGRLLYNRAIRPRQPGSAIKPISVYGPALQSGADAVLGTQPYYPRHEVNFEPKMDIGGAYWTAASIIHDIPITLDDKPWPKNWYPGNRGAATVRTSLELSINVNAVKVFSQIGWERSVDFMKKLGVSTLVLEGNVNDVNAAALALGGMSSGISPLQMAGAYGAFANGGAYNSPVTYTKVTYKNGDVLLSKTPENLIVMDPGVAFIMTDILRTTVTSGIAGRAAVKGRLVAGKTGTTSDNYDAWFVGITPEYAVSLWIGNDLNIELSEGSMSAARLWGKIMEQVLSGAEEGSFLPMPDNVVRASGEYFIKGTEWRSIIETVVIEEPEELEGEGGSEGTEEPGVQREPENRREPEEPREPETPARLLDEEISGGGERPAEQSVY
jgi:penicillin-binding protein 1A